MTEPYNFDTEGSGHPLATNDVDNTFSNEIRYWKRMAVYQRACAIKLYDDAYPDVGPGMFWSVCVDQALEELDVELDEIDYMYLIKEMA